ncbi:hypothetical protein LXA43DRAFT_887951, partial [Ganoderma leucocontextum]
SSLQGLHEDVLVQIFELLRPDRGLRSLSATCKSIRGACAPLLFKHCVINIEMPMVPERLLPPHGKGLSPPPLHRRSSSLRRHGWTSPETCLVCYARLRSILVYFLSNEVHGLRWETLTSILSNFGLQLFNFSPRPHPATSVDTLSLAPLRSFRYIQPAFHWIPHHFPPERDALADVLVHLHNSLELLHLPSMSAPINMLSVDPWPRLRELVLQGQLPENIHSPFITLFSGMPKLRVLSLMFAFPRDVNPQPVWPRGLDTSFPWPELESLVLSFPTPDDQLYASLPPCLRRLSLGCCPHHCVHEWVDRPEWRSPVLSASEALAFTLRLFHPATLEPSKEPPHEHKSFPFFDTFRRMPATFLDLPPELHLLIKGWISPSDIRTHACFYLSEPQCACL